MKISYTETQSLRLITQLVPQWRQLGLILKSMDFFGQKCIFYLASLQKFTLISKWVFNRKIFYSFITVFLINGISKLLKSSPFVFLIFTLGIFLPEALFGLSIKEKVLICGVCRDVERAVPNTILSAEKLGKEFQDYRVVIYENNSKDKTKEFLQQWAERNPRVIFLSEALKRKKLRSQLMMNVRTEKIARARNKVLDEIMKDTYNDYRYVIWADLDFLDPWDVKNIIDTIQNPEEEWDGVFANGAYDLFAYRDAEFPIGIELIGGTYWDRLDEMRTKLIIDPKGKWKRVYSGFGGLGIYKREAIKGCRYSGVASEDLRYVISDWLKQAADDVWLMKEYKERAGKQISFVCPWTCEHIVFHASMTRKGRDKFFINPRLISKHP